MHRRIRINRNIGIIRELLVSAGVDAAAAAVPDNKEQMHSFFLIFLFFYQTVRLPPKRRRPMSTRLAGVADVARSA